MGTGTDAIVDEARGLQLVRLLQLASPSLPVGAFSYSQGLEYAVETGWVGSVAAFEDWLRSVIDENLVHLELPLLARLVAAVETRDDAAVAAWVARLVAFRETRELREEEERRGRAMVRVLESLDITVPPAMAAAVAGSQLAGMAVAAVHWRLPVDLLLLANASSWLENQVMAGIKLIPLGQSDGQRLLADLSGDLPRCVSRALAVADDDIGASSPALAIASSLHETQYTRLFRS